MDHRGVCYRPQTMENVQHIQSVIKVYQHINLLMSGNITLLNQDTTLLNHEKSSDDLLCLREGNESYF